MISVGIHALATIKNVGTYYCQYNIVKLDSVQAGVDAMTTNVVLALAIFVFKTYLIHRVGAAGGRASG